MVPYSFFICREQRVEGPPHSYHRLPACRKQHRQCHKSCMGQTLICFLNFFALTQFCFFFRHLSSLISPFLMLLPSQNIYTTSRVQILSQIKQPNTCKRWFLQLNYLYYPLTSLSPESLGPQLTHLEETNKSFYPLSLIFTEKRDSS